MGAVVMAMVVGLVVSAVLLIEGVALWLAVVAYVPAGCGVFLLLWVVDWATKNREP